MGRLYYHIDKDRSRSGRLELGPHPGVGVGCKAEGREQGVSQQKKPEDNEQRAHLQQSHLELDGQLANESKRMKGQDLEGAEHQQGWKWESAIHFRESWEVLGKMVSHEGRIQE